MKFAKYQTRSNFIKSNNLYSKIFKKKFKLGPATLIYLHMVSQKPLFFDTKIFRAGQKYLAPEFCNIVKRHTLTYNLILEGYNKSTPWLFLKNELESFQTRKVNSLILKLFQKNENAFINQENLQLLKISHFFKQRRDPNIRRRMAYTKCIRKINKIKLRAYKTL